MAKAQNRISQKAPNGAEISRIDGRYRYYEVRDAAGEKLTFDLASGQTARLTSVTTYLNFPSKGALLPWAARTAAQEAVSLSREAFLSVMSQSRPDENQSARSALDERLAEIEKEAAQTYRKSRDAAADLGTRVHLWVERDLQGEVQDIPDDIAPAIQAYRSWRASSDFTETAGLERMVYYAEPPVCYAGTIDALFRLSDGTLGAVDYKTSSGIYESHMVQIAAYAKAWEWLSGETVSRAWTVRFDKKTGELEEKEADIEAGFEIFSSLVPARDLYSKARKTAYKSE